MKNEQTDQAAEKVTNIFKKQPEPTVKTKHKTSHHPSKEKTSLDADFSEKLGHQVTELTADLQRTRADFENYRKQVDIQKSQLAEATRLDTVKKILPLLDDIDRAIAAHPELQPLAKNLAKTMTELNLEKIDTTVGVEFNPDYHDAISMEETDGEKEVISETLRPGYLYHQAVLRAAMVRVKRV